MIYKYKYVIASCLIAATMPNSLVAQTPSRVIEEVVVTSQKRSQDVQDVPISIAVVGEDMIDDAGISDVNDLSQFVPNLVINLTPAVGFVAMRGLGSGNNKGFERSVAMQVDGIYYGRQDYLFEALADTKQIEVLRGPQGTLFGKNAIAGAINVTTGEASADFTGKLAIQGGDYRRERVRLAVAGPLVPDVMHARVTWDSDDMDGVIRNSTFDLDPANNPHRENVDKNLRDKKQSIGRIKLMFPEIVDNLDIRLSATKAKVYSNSTALQLTRAEDYTLGLYRDYDPKTEDDIKDFTTSINEDEKSIRNGTTYTAHLDYWLGEFQLSAILGTSEFDKVTDFDADFGPIDALSVFNDDIYRQRSAELRVVSPPGRFEYVAGLYYFNNEIIGSGQVFIKPDRALQMVEAAQTGGAVGATTLLSPVLQAIFAGAAGGDLQNNNRFFDQETKSYAAFGQGTLNLYERWSLILGLRYSEEEKIATQILSYSDATAELLFNQFIGETAYNETGERKEYDFSPKFSVRYDVSDEITMYATYATAFKAGGFNEQAADDTNLTFEPEEAVTYEAGIKSRFYNGAATLNVGLFRTEFDNLQVSLFDGLNFVVGNAAAAVSQGIEIDGQLIPSDWLVFIGSTAYLDAYYTEYEDGQCPATSEESKCDLSGKELTRAPELEASLTTLISLTNLIPSLGEAVPFDIGLGIFINYRDHQFLTTDLDPVDAMEAHTEVGAALSFKDESEQWDFTISVKNLTDEIILQGAVDVPLQPGTHAGVIGAPRRVYAELKYQW